ncbi:MAG: nuclear transport factor 2 family protein [Planctomycetota bacterium]|nr:nuclear transport factor 2 family protein [Planctomycetota bacterium]MEC8510572.1 nuclear transport factor 2 family protein [Planctomycetota bacterium]MEE2940047.1 nuclear transport factor 2 family protein [Planctomycetota bacterium]
MYRTLSTLSLLVASSFLAASCNSTGQSAAPVDAAEGSGIVTRGDDERTAQLRSALEAFTRNDQDFAKSYTSEDHMIYMADGSEPVGLEEWNAFADASHRAFKDMEFANLAMVTSDYPEYGVWSYAWCTFLATSRATGEQFRFPLHIMWQWDGDKVVREFHYADTTRFNAHLEDSLAAIDG